MDYICIDCIEDRHLKEIIENEGLKNKCSECDEIKEKSIAAKMIGEIMEPVLRILYCPGEFRSRMSSMEDERSYDVQAGESVSNIVEERIGQDLKCLDGIVQGVVSRNVFDRKGFGEAFWDEDSSYELNYEIYFPMDASWENTLDELKYSRRFFSPLAKTLFSNLFSDVDLLRARKGNRQSEKVVKTLPAGTFLYRARGCHTSNDVEKFINSPLLHVGPPSPEFSRAGRMNAEGVVVLYAAKDEKTCLAEMRPALGGELALIKLKTNKELRILDFSLFEKSFFDEPLSIFHPKYHSERTRRSFLRRLHKLISQPIVPGHESNYVITQTMAEYLAHVHKPEFDGISFSSAQRKGGVNVVVFPDKDLLAGDVSVKYGVDYVADSISFFSTESIKYVHERKKFFQNSAGDWVSLGAVDPEPNNEW